MTSLSALPFLGEVVYEFSVKSLVATPLDGAVASVPPMLEKVDSGF
jgi:hypothetical protein